MSINVPSGNATKAYLFDLGERVVTAAVLAFLGQLLASGFFDVSHVTDMSIVEKAGVSALIAALSVVKGVVAKFVGNRNSPSLLPGIPAPAETQ